MGGRADGPDTPAALTSTPTAADALRQGIDGAADVGALARASAGIRPLAIDALDRGEPAGAITTAISVLNDAVVAAAVRLVARDHDADLTRACWLVFGSQARSEQTIATDQDNGLVFDSDDADADRPRWLAFGQAVNEALAACGYPLCSGGVMAGRSACCLTRDEWLARFGHWVGHGHGQDLFGARLYFDLRPLAGRQELAAPLQAMLCSSAVAVPRFLKQLADAVLRRPVALDWLGRVRTEQLDGREVFDLKTQGTALFVDAARLWALAQGVAATGTVERLRAVAPAIRLPAAELRQWVQGFDALQRLRLRVQRQHPDEDPDRRCHADWRSLPAAERQSLQQALRAARWMQRRLQLDWST